MANFPQSKDDLIQLPHAFAHYILLYKPCGTAIPHDLTVPDIVKELPTAQVTSRVYYIGRREVRMSGVSNQEIMSLHAHPNFYNKPRFSGLLARVPHHDNPSLASYYFGEAR